MNAFQRFLERTRLPLLIIILVPIVAALYVFFGADLNSPAPTTNAPVQTVAQNTTPTPPPPASISLDDPQSLPQSVAAAQLVPFSFTVQNQSNQSATYQYKVSVHWSTGEEDVIDENTLSFAAGASQTIPEQLKFEIATETAEVSFQLPQTQQSIQFALPRTQ